MEVEPIYCAEQIVVPPDLADILKAFTKEIIRRQPGDLIDFSAKYFANLANVSGSVQGTPAPTREQLHQAAGTLQRLWEGRALHHKGGQAAAER